MEVFKTLIVDGNAAIRWILTEILSVQFPTMIIREAAEGKEALQKVEDLQPNLIFMDIGLPDQNGLELTREIKVRYPNITIVIFSSYTSADYKEVAYRNGASYYLVKGTNISGEITSLVESILLGFGYNKYGFKIDW